MNVWFLEQHQAPGTAKMGAEGPCPNGQDEWEES